jgi:hypothetical protein
MTFSRSPNCVKFFAFCLSWGSASYLRAGTPVPTYGTYFGGSGDTNIAVGVVVDRSGKRHFGGLHFIPNAARNDECVSAYEGGWIP